MILRRNLFLWLFALAVSFDVRVQNYGWKETQGGGHKYKYVAHGPTNSRFYTLKNGLTVILGPTNKEPYIQCYVAVEAGNKTDPSTNIRLVHYLGHLLFKGADKYGSLNWEKEKVQLDKIGTLYEKYNHTKDAEKHKAVYKKIGSASGVASKYAIANEYDKIMTAMGIQDTSAFISFEKTVYTDDVPTSTLNEYITVQAERSRNSVLHIFRTELEAVYEEKSRSLDSDDSEVFKALFASLFKKHNHGLQITIDTVKHLENPSLKEVHKYFHIYYVPNDMTVILSGDFSPDEMIAEIDKALSYMAPKTVPQYIFEKEGPISAPIIRKVIGPDAENVSIAFRLPDSQDKGALLADLVGGVLTNGKAGLIDLNLAEKQELLGASTDAYTPIDYGMLYLPGRPLQGRPLEQVKDLILGEVENLKKGSFDDDLTSSIINNMKRYVIQDTESYANRANTLIEIFTNNLDWRDHVVYVDSLPKMTKTDIVVFANKYLGNNYVVIYEEKKQRTNVEKMEEPTITPAETNVGKQSAFVKMMSEMPSTPVKPAFLDYSKDLQKGKLGKAEVLYVQDKDNEPYCLSLRYKVGTLNDLKLAIAASYSQFLGIDKKSAEQPSKELHKIAPDLNISASGGYTAVNIEGSQENFETAVKLYGDLIANIKADEEALRVLKTRAAKTRIDSEANRGATMQASINYALYEAESPCSCTSFDVEIEAITGKELVEKLKKLSDVEQAIIYYGPLSLDQLTAKLKPFHRMLAEFAQAVPRKEFKQVEQTGNQVLFAGYEVIQAETCWIRNIVPYNPAESTTVKAFSNCFGGGMGPLVLQTTRESKALAHNTYSYYVTPSKKTDRYYILAYVGSQVNKFKEAVEATDGLLNAMPELPANLELAKQQIRQEIETECITRDGTVCYYLHDQRTGLKEDIRKQIYQDTDNITMKGIKTFHDKYLPNKPYTYVILASERKLPEDELKKIGDFKKLSLEELFGY